MNKCVNKYHPWVPVTTAWRVPWVADGGVGLQIWRLAANILNNSQIIPPSPFPSLFPFLFTTTRCQLRQVYAIITTYQLFLMINCIYKFFN